MAFIRSYARQGDPLGAAFIRAGVLARPRVGPRRGPGFQITQGRFFTPSHPSGYMRAQAMAGDPFLGKFFKGIKKAAKKITLKGVVKYPIRIKCAVLAWDVLQEALDGAGNASGSAPHSV